MVTCHNEGASLGGFHLGVQDDYRPRAPSVSSLSHYKQKIDALFDDSRSITSLAQYGPMSDRERKDSKVSITQDSKATVIEDESGYCQTKMKKINNTVQDRIERMFADMAGESRLTIETIGVHVFNVHYLGSTPLQSKVSSLSGLQDPLRDLYFAYKRNFRQKSTLTGRLEISKSGLKVRYKGEKGDLEQLNPFPTIAVWSAVKFVVQPLEKDQNELSYAFVPLITDPDNIDRHALFKALDSSEKKYILSHNENSHSPLFAVVMRKIGVAKQLECHGFVCQTTEDAIVIAATLYKSLMSHMSRQGHTESKKLKNRNGISCMSISSSVAANDIPVRPPRKKRSTSSLSGDSDKADGFSASESFCEKPKVERTKNLTEFPNFSNPCLTNLELKRITVEEVRAKLDTIKHDTSGSETQGSKKSINKTLNAIQVMPSPNPQPQSSSENSVRSKVSEKIELFRELERRKSIQRPPTLPPPVPAKPKPQSDQTKEPLRRSQSGRKSLSESGDILTKVAIPRSGSFLNAGGLTRYKSIGQRNNGKKGGGSPLGFNELFNEFKVQENLHSMDEILSVIIDPEGMSFNDLKPIYKEFLLKLAVTLTKDEIFQHSKAIMKKQKKKILRRNSTFQNKRRKIFKGASGLRMVFRLPFGKEVRKKEKKAQQNLFEIQNVQDSATVKDPICESSVSTSSYDIRQFRPKEPEVPAPKRQIRQRNSKRSEKSGHVSKRSGKGSRPGERTSTSEDSDFLTLSNRLGCQNRNSSSGYVSCSECESESCVDRCYCSLKADCKPKCCCTVETGKDSAKTKLIGKSCKDCLNCADSNKCYCTSPRRPIQSSQSLEYLKAPSTKTPSDRVKRTFEDYEGKPRTRSGASSRRREERRRAKSSDSLALDYELLLQNKPRDARARNMQRLTVRSTGAGSEDALSVKKSAEMAALFADVRLSQRTDVRSMAGGRRARPPPLSPPGVPPIAKLFDHRPLSRNPSLEDTLGYFP
ncbi:jg10925 [Pararge aegeria aegeria]|uniref:Jg10925 protein n=1 Tax=Pararge aegeria aegeria TaxID=348720 RepID=A0A8S4SIT4_9NEOP|nr:jg10925 [Pararge aegeria aegeria]